jgi:Ca2+-binding RTX toxin-like protein
MVGGDGSDSYVVDDYADVVTELIAQGIDTVYTGLNYYLLGANVENLTLLGFDDLNATGNTLNNKMEGNGGNNYLYGHEGNDSLKGNENDDILDGGVGADQMVGGDGHDIYEVDNAGDVVSEAVAQGIDWVYSTVSYTLGANVEHLDLLDFAAINGVGNALNNIIYGNDANNSISGLDGLDTLYGEDGNDALNGGAGTDFLAGGRGNDTYIVTAGDVVAEWAAEGLDVVVTAASYTLGANVENLTLTDAAVIDGTGNDLDNYMLGNAARNVLNTNGGNDLVNGRGGDDVINGGIGNDTMVGDIGNDALTGAAGNDILYGNDGSDTLSGQEGNDYLTGGNGGDRLSGGFGNDTLWGGLSGDIFVFSAQGEGVDIIKDFNRAEGDKIEITASFGATSFNQFSYNSATGALFFDASPADAIAPVQVATIENKPAGFSPQFDLIVFG